MDSKTIRVIARQELVISVRNKWTIMFAVVFGILVVGVSYFGIMAEGFSGMQNFTRTSATLLNLVLYIVPLVALTMGTLSFTGEKGSAELLFAQPVSRTEVLLGKMLGLFCSITLSTVIGFLVAGIIIAEVSGAGGISRYVAFVGLSLALSLVFLSVAVFASTLVRRTSKAFGLSLFLWFFFVLFYDLLAIAGMLFLSGRAATTFLFLSLFGNPVDLVRVASLIVLDNVTMFGAAGAAMLRFLGGTSASVALLIAGLAVWTIIPLGISSRMLARQDI